jgi:hypothetical protein
MYVDINSHISAHLNFIASLPEEKKAKCYQNDNHQFLVKTRQETMMYISTVSNITHNEGTIACGYT